MADTPIQLALAITADAHEAQEEVAELFGKISEAFGSVKDAATNFELSLDSLSKTAFLVEAAIVGLTGAIIGLGVHGTEIGDVSEGFDRLATSTANAEEMLTAMRTGVAGTIDDMQLMTDANHLLAAGVKANADDFGTMTSAARVLSREGMGPLSDVMNKIDTAMEMGNAKRLARIGVIVDTKAAEQAYANTLGEQLSDLTASEKKIADRQAIIAALARTVQSAGAQELTFGEKISAAEVAVENWFNALAKGVAESPEVNKALDTMLKAFNDAFGGESKSLLDGIIAGINMFANAITTYGPVVIQTVKSIRDEILTLATDAKNTWNAIPDWAKYVAENFIIVGGAAYIVTSALEMIGGATIISGIQGVGSALTLLYTATVGAGWAGFTAVLEGWFGALTPIPAIAAAASTAIAGLESGVAIAAVTFGGLALAVGAVAAILTAGYQAFMLWQESKERDAANNRQAVVDGENLARINDTLGTSYKLLTGEAAKTQAGIAANAKTMADATAASDAFAKVMRQGYLEMDTVIKEFAQDSGVTWKTAIDDMAATAQGMAENGDLTTKALKQIAQAVLSSGVAFKDLPPVLQSIVTAFKEMKPPIDDGGDSLSKHEKAVQKLLDAFRGGTPQMQATVDAFSRLSQSEKDSADAVDFWIPKVDQLVNAHQKVPPSLMAWYNAALQTRSAVVAQGAATLAAMGITQDYIETMKAQGESEQEIATQLGVPVKALKEYEKELQQSATVQDIVSKANMAAMQAEASVRKATVDDTIAQLDREEQAAQDKLMQDAITGKIAWNDLWEAQEATYEEFQAKRVAAAQKAADTEFKAEEKLHDDLLAAQDAFGVASLAKDVANLELKRDREQEALLENETDWENHWIKVGEIDDKYDQLEANKREASRVATNNAIMANDQQVVEEQINLLMTGLNKELAVNDLKRTEAKRLLEDKLTMLQEQEDAEGVDNDLEISRIQAQLDSIDRLYDSHAHAIVAKLDPIRIAWQGLNDDMRQSWADTWTSALNGTASFVDALLSPFKTLEQQWLKLMGAMAADWENQFIAKLTGIDVAGTGGAGGNTKTAGGLMQGLMGKLGLGNGDQTITTTPGAGGDVASIEQGGESGVDALANLSNEGADAAEGAVTTGATAATSVALGAVTMGIGAALPFIISGLKSLFGDHTAQDIARDAGEKFGTTFSKATTDAIMADKNSGMTETAAELNNLTSIIKDAGGLNSGNLEQMTSRLHDVFSMIQTGQMTIAQGTKVIDDNWQAFVTAGTAADGRLSDSLKQIIQLQSQFGTQSQQITQYLQTQANTAETAFNAVTAGMLPTTKTDVYDALKKSVDDALTSLQALGGYTTGADGQMQYLQAPTPQQQAAIDAYNQALANQKAGADLAASGLKDLGIQAVATFSAAVASGTDEATALKNIHPALASLEQSYSDLGISTDDAALSALMLRDKVETAAPQMSAAVDGLSQEMVALDNMGLMNVDTLGAMERTGQSMYDQLSAQVVSMGGTSKDALGMMQSYLHEAATEAQNLGVPLDANTQALIKQSEDAGVWQTALTPQDKLTQGIQTLVDKVTSLVNALRGIPDKVNTTVTTTFDSYGNPINPDGSPAGGPAGGANVAPSIDAAAAANGVTIQTNAGGNLITSPTLSWLGEGAEPEIVGPVSFMQTALEGAISSLPSNSMGFLTPQVMPQQQQASQQMIPAQDTAAPPQPVILQVSLQAIDGPSVDRFVRSPEFVQSITNALRFNKNSLYTKMRGGLGLPS